MKSNQLLEDTIAGNEDAVAQALDEIHGESTSILQYNNEKSLSCAITLAYYTVRREYEMIRELPAGKGKMIALGADTFWEAFDPDRPDYSPYGNPIVSSYCHAWSCTPVYLIQKYL